MTLTPPAEVLLSYFTGLAPVGLLFEPRVANALTDLGYVARRSIYIRLSELIRTGCIKKHAYGGKGTFGLLSVVKRLEHMPVPLPPESSPASPEITHNRVKRAATRPDWFARLAEIPPDTRTLTQRAFGDPLPERSALYRRQHA